MSKCISTTEELLDLLSKELYEVEFDKFLAVPARALNYATVMHEGQYRKYNYEPDQDKEIESWGIINSSS